MSGKWNHLVLGVERTRDDKVLFRTIELNEKVAILMLSQRSIDNIMSLSFSN